MNIDKAQLDEASREKRRPTTLTRLVEFTAAGLVLAGLISLLPDLKRYIRIHQM